MGGQDLDKVVKNEPGKANWLNGETAEKCQKARKASSG